MAVQLRSDQPIRSPGCGRSCGVVRALVPGSYGWQSLPLHDPEAHEAYGWTLAGAGDGVNVNAVCTGPLVVDASTLRVTGAGADVSLTAIQLAILLELAARPGAVRSQERIVAAVWGPAEVPIARGSGRGRPFHGLRVHLARLRQRLGVAGCLVETVAGIGVRLRVEPPTGAPA